MNKRYKVDENGYYGNFGGAYIPEILYATVQELKKAYEQAMQDDSFFAEFESYLRDYVGRPSPLYYAKNLSEKYSAKIYLKREDLNHTGSHKINNAIGQILLAKRMGKKRILAETGAGQHGVATATACALMGLECTVFMGALDVERQSPNVEKMKMLGARVEAVTSGNKTLKDATNEAIRFWCCNPEDCYYLIGSVVGPDPYPQMVAKFQSVISQEIEKQLLEKEGKPDPDYVIACVGGGSNAAGAFYNYLEKEDVKLVAVEAAGLGLEKKEESAATLALGSAGILHGSKTMLMQDDFGQVIEPYSISAGLDYPGIGPMHAHLAQVNRIEVEAATDSQALEAAMLLTRTEGIIPALESSHALAALEFIKFKADDVVVVNLSGRGDKDMQTYLKNKI